MPEIVWVIVLGAALLALLVILVIALVSAIFHLRQSVAFVPTYRSVADAMIDLAAPKPGELVVDLGAGDGRILERALERVSGIRAVGYEGALGVWMLGKLRHLFTQFRPVLLRKDFLTVDLSDVDVVFTYLGLDMMEKLRPKLERELKPGSRIVSHAFSVRAWQPKETRKVPMPFFGETSVYLYVR